MYLDLIVSKFIVLGLLFCDEVKLGCIKSLIWMKLLNWCINSICIFVMT